MDLTTAKDAKLAKIEQFRQELVDELPTLARQYIDTARAEATTAAFEKVMNTALKVIEGLEVEKAKDKYANLPVINFVIGPDMHVTATVEPAPPVVDAQAREVTTQTPALAEALPTNPLELLDGQEETPLPAHQGQEADALRQKEEEALLALDEVAGALALD